MLEELLKSWEKDNIVDFPYKVDFVTEVQHVYPKFPDTKPTEGEHCQKIPWILLKGDKKSSFRIRSFIFEWLETIKTAYHAWTVPNWRNSGKI